MHKLNIKPYETNKGKRYIAEGAYLGVDSITGKKVRTTIRGNTKKEVKEKYQKLYNEFKNNGNTKQKKATIKTFNELTDAWLVYYKNTVSNSTYYGTTNAIKNYIRPMLGDYRLEKITPALLQNKINEFIDTHANERKDYKKVLTYANRIFKYGVSLDLIKTNPMDRVLIHTVKNNTSTEPIKYYNKQELKKLIDILKPNEWKDTCIRLLIFTGMRTGECLSLNWNDIDFDNKTLSINKTLDRFGKVMSSTKTETGDRTIKLDDDTLTFLNQYKQAQIKRAWDYGLKPPKALFYNMLQNEHYGYRNLYAWFKQLCMENSLPQIGLHGLRHTHATMYLNAGEDLKVLQERLGHKSLNITADVYSHVLPENEEKSLNNVVKFIAN